MRKWKDVESEVRFSLGDDKEVGLCCYYSAAEMIKCRLSRPVIMTIGTVTRSSSLKVDIRLIIGS